MLIYFGYLIIIFPSVIASYIYFRKNKIYFINHNQENGLCKLKVKTKFFKDYVFNIKNEKCLFNELVVVLEAGRTISGYGNSPGPHGYMNRGSQARLDVFPENNKFIIEYGGKSTIINSDNIDLQSEGELLGVFSSSGLTDIYLKNKLEKDDFLKIYKNEKNLKTNSKEFEVIDSDFRNFLFFDKSLKENKEYEIIGYKLNGELDNNQKIIFMDNYQKQKRKILITIIAFLIPAILVILLISINLI